MSGTDILAVDVGTTALKLGVFSAEMEPRCAATRRYDVNVYGQGRADIEAEKWWRALRECCGEVAAFLRPVGVVSLSVTTPGLLPMAEDGTALAPAMLRTRRAETDGSPPRRRERKNLAVFFSASLRLRGGQF